MFKVDRDICIACEQCIKDCPVNDIYLKEGKAHIKNEACIKCGHCIAICPVKAVSTDDYDMSEVIEYKKEDFQIEPERLLNFIKFRRSVRRFKNKEVEKEKIEKIIEAGRFAPTSTNSQDVSYTVLQKELPKIKALTYEILNKKGQYILENMNDNIKHLERYANLWTKMYEAHKLDPKANDRLFLNAPLAIVISAKTPLDGGLASANMELMVDSLGLGTYFNGFFQVAAQDNEELLNLLNIPKEKQLISCLVIGYPNVSYKRTVPREKADITWS
ncbi:MAG: nitroreductase family protein [Terrisporobacter sp.]|uniref:nitroreductase family protein n=1 Tax=Terrisporobacter sp. TaxID=1965305 RepID=UPI0025D79C40|nr:nitroreductase family protein [uncultured Terrisporobacter sp.]